MTGFPPARDDWVPACAGMTEERKSDRETLRFISIARCGCYNAQPKAICRSCGLLDPGCSLRSIFVPTLRENPVNQPIVNAINVSRYFKRGSERVDVLDNLSLQVPEGQFLALMGPSGSGKTTLLNLIAGLDTPSSGEIWVGESLVSKMSESQLARWRTENVGFVFQFYHLLPVLSAYENVELPLLLLPLSSKKRREQVMTALDLVGLHDRSKHIPSQLSGGQQQRVGIARAIVTDPTLIVADEPTGDLDAKSAHEILDLMCTLQRSLNKTILMVTHDPRAAKRADRIQYLDKGQLVDKPEDELYEAG